MNGTLRKLKGQFVLSGQFGHLRIPHRCKLPFAVLSFLD
ncbi:hypothetical protein A8990_12466 [Paenibacillus taihuensis]|uniref:Uncharacterized protein n=1 Tax=Paenibacillus taihuensis TaxID=1156355 RepID=A0A3D9RPH4_9BACL|nr:hypothetical protein A8990_12466 [Paenibacillus taihuensis]